MRIGLISDTHVPEISRAIPPRVAEAFDGVDLILHAGDLSVLAILDELQRIAPVLAARGDDDYQIEDERIEDVQQLNFDGTSIYVIAARGDDDYQIEDERIEDVQQLNFDGTSIYVVHSSVFWARSIIERPADHDLEKAPDVVVFGHTHRDWMENVGESLLVSPGSAVFPYYQLRLGTVALLTIGNGAAQAQIVDLGEE